MDVVTVAPWTYQS